MWGSIFVVKAVFQTAASPASPGLIACGCIETQNTHTQSSFLSFLMLILSLSQSLLLALSLIETHSNGNNYAEQREREGLGRATTPTTRVIAVALPLHSGSMQSQPEAKPSAGATQVARAQVKVLDNCASLILSMEQ